MASFEIDTGIDPMRGAYRIDKNQGIQDAARDSVGFSAAPEVYHAAVAEMVVRDLTRPKTPETARRHFLGLWPLIAAMATEAPASFDHIILEFAEHLDGFR